MSRKNRLFSRFYPKTLTGQLMASLLLALIVAQIISFFVLLDERHVAIASAQRDQVLARTASIVRVLTETPVELHRRVTDSASTLQLRFSIDPESIVDSSNIANTRNRFAIRLNRLLERPTGDVLVEVKESLFWDWPQNGGFRPRDVDDDFDGERRWRHGDDDDDDYDDDDDIHHMMSGNRYGMNSGRHWMGERPPVTNLLLSVRLDAHTWLNADYRVFGPVRGWAKTTFLTIAVVAILIYLVTFLMLRRLTRPLKNLAEAAESLGRGENVASLDETGPVEIRQTTVAFNHMKDSLRRFVDDRTRMLAAISHDLRTPLTTLRLRAEMLEDGETKTKILETLDEMKRMTEATLAFAREDATREETRTVDLSALIESIVLDFQDLGHIITFDPPDATPYRCRPFGLKRAFRNLIENAFLYGERANVKLLQTSEGIDVIIEDNGPGISEEDQERIFEPFVRLEESRSQDTGGIGLGLAIARTIIRAHGGDIALSNRPEGGLSVRVILPPDVSVTSQ